MSSFRIQGELPRGLLVAALVLATIVPVSAAASSPSSTPATTQSVPVVERAVVPVLPGGPDSIDPQAAPVSFWDAEAGILVVPPKGWVRSPETALDANADEDAMEIVRFQVRIDDPALYAQPVPITSGLLKDAKAVISVALAREGGELAQLDVDAREDRETVRSLPGFYVVDEENAYDGVRTIARYLIARETDRRVVIRASVGAEDWAAYADVLRAAVAAVRADAAGPNAPAAPPPPPPPPPVAVVADDEEEEEDESAPAAAIPDPSTAARNAIIARAASMLGTPYVWGGNAPGRGLDCSAYVSAAWGVARYTTDSIGRVSYGISKDELRPGDAMNLPTWRDPSRYGHIRMFAAWANEARSLVWVYEETPPRAVYRVIAYDNSYQAIRLVGLSGGGHAPMIAAPAPAPQRQFVPAPVRTPAPRQAVTSTPRPKATPKPATPKPTAKPATPKPSVTPKPPVTPRVTATPRPLATAGVTATPKPATPRPTATPIVTPRPTVTAKPTVAPTPTVKAATVTAKPQPTPKNR